MKRLGTIVLVMAFLALAVLPVSADDGGRNAILGSNYVLRSGERRATDLVVVGGQVRLEADSVVEGNVSLLGGDLLVDGTVQGDVVVLGGSVTLGSAAVIGGDLVTFGNIRRDSGARIQGNVVEGIEAGANLRYLSRLFQDQAGLVPVRPAPAQRPVRGSDAARAVSSLATLLAVLVVAALMTLALPDHLSRMARVMERQPLLSLGIGGLTILVVLILTPILIILCLGIPLAIILGIALMLCALLGWVAAGRLLGHKLVQLLNLRRVSALGEVLLGTLLVSLVGMIPCIGWLVTLVVASWGVGSAVLTRFGTVSYPPSPWNVASATPSGAAVPPAPPEAPNQPAPPPAPAAGRDTHRLSDNDLVDREAHSSA